MPDRIPAPPAEYRGRQILQVETRQAWRDWLAANHDTSPGVWFVSWRTGAGRTGVSYEETVEEALCFGWIDSQVKVLDEYRTIQLLTPRRPRSIWARSNKERVARLMAAGLMTPAGLAPIEAAQADGSWSMYDPVDALIEPADLASALDAVPAARISWSGFSPSARRWMLWWVTSAKRPETRSTRISAIVREAAAGRRAGGA